MILWFEIFSVKVQNSRVSEVSGFSLHTCSLHESLVQSESDDRLFEFPQVVFETATHRMDVLDFTEHDWSFPLNELISELLHQTLSSRNSVQSFLQTNTARTQQVQFRLDAGAL